MWRPCEGRESREPLFRAKPGYFAPLLIDGDEGAGMSCFKSRDEGAQLIWGADIGPRENDTPDAPAAKMCEHIPDASVRGGGPRETRHYQRSYSGSQGISVQRRTGPVWGVTANVRCGFSGGITGRERCE